MRKIRIMKLKKYLLLLLIPFFNCFQVAYSQEKNVSIVFRHQRSKYDAEFCGIEGNFKHEITFYSDSTFIYTRETRSPKDTTMGTYSSNNNEIILNSYDQFKTHPIKVSEFNAFRFSREYVLNSYGLGVSIIEIDTTLKDKTDTIFFYKVENNVIVRSYNTRKSFNKNVIGFRVYKYDQLCDEYYFNDPNSKKVLLEIIESTNHHIFYLKNNVVKIVNKDCIIIDSYVPLKFIRYIPEYFKEPLDLNGYQRNLKNTSE